MVFNIKLIKSERGATFIIVAVVLTVITIMLSLLLATTSAEVRVSKSYANGIKAYYIADCGIQRGIAFVLSDIAGTSTTIPLSDIGVAEQQYKSNTVTCTVAYSGGIYTITSTANYDKTNVPRLQISRKITATVRRISSTQIEIITLKQG